ncbi:pectinesterase-like [Coffea arabica]|uniref:Pectinesterase n=1 Tax=Coffea arabica TaxID=13443 RepID=A0A6P6VSW5_COFAR
MANTYQSLLDAPKKKTGFKVLFLVLFLAAILGAIAIASITILKSTQTVISSSPRSHLCSKAHDQSSCMALVSELTSAGLLQSSDVELLQMLLAKSSSRIQETIELTNNINRRINDQKGQAALADCLELMDISMDRVMDSMVSLGSQTANSHSDVHSWLSSVLTNHVTCLDGLNGLARPAMEPLMKELISRARASLAMLVAIAPSEEEMIQEPLNGDFPSWVTHKDRRLLQSSAKNINANVVVAQDGSGNYKTVQEAVTAAPNNPQTRYVIYVKKGTYKEKVDIGKSKKNLMLVGDGMDLTIITDSLNVVDGSTTFQSATVAAVADGFIAQDIWFQNTAGPQKQQAVALRVGADQSVINRCKIDAFQDTLYAHTLRQFYRDCYITGTVDYIFGDAAVVFQNSQLVARKPLSNQQNMVTAQGRVDPNSNTGTSIQNCDIIASSDLAPVKATIKTFLGRPWKEYSRTVVMQSNIGDHIDPTGWAPWSGDFALKTLYYGEYMNKGPGAGTSKRVNWPGYRVITTAAEASKFTVAQLIQGGQWLKNTGVAYTEGL